MRHGLLGLQYVQRNVNGQLPSVISGYIPANQIQPTQQQFIAVIMYEL